MPESWTLSLSPSAVPQTKPQFTVALGYGAYNFMRISRTTFTVVIDHYMVHV